MDKQQILNKYTRPEDKMLISKMLDKVKLTQTKNAIEYTDFLDNYQQQLLHKVIQQEKIQNVIFAGGIENAERKILLFYPEKLSAMAEKNINAISPIQCIRIQLPKEMQGQYQHRNYLGGVLKLGVKREKIGDIMVGDDGADLLVLEEIEKFVLTNLLSLTRFHKATIEKVKLEQAREKEIHYQVWQIIVPSLRIDAVTAELLRTSRGKAEQILQEGRIFLNYEEVQKGTKQVKEGDILTVRGKEKFKIGTVDGTTRSGRSKVKVYQYV